MGLVHFPGPTSLGTHLFAFLLLEVVVFLVGRLWEGRGGEGGKRGKGKNGKGGPEREDGVETSLEWVGSFGGVVMPREWFGLNSVDCFDFLFTFAPMEI